MRIYALIKISGLYVGTGEIEIVVMLNWPN